MEPVVILGAARTPIGKLMGALAYVSAVELGATAIAAALSQAGVSPEDVGATVMGQVLTGGAGQLPARQAAVAAGIPMRVPSLSVNKVCISGLSAVATGAHVERLTG